MNSPQTILISAAGSSIGLEVAKSLRAVNGCAESGGAESAGQSQSGAPGPSHRLLGTEVSWWGAQLAAQYCDEVVTLPRGDEPGFVAAFRELLESRDVALAFLNTDPEMEAIADVRDEIATPLSCPRQSVLADCLDKQRLHERLRERDLVAPTRVVRSRADVDDALARFGSPIWLRCAVGPRGRGSIIVQQPDEAIWWIEYWRRRGEGGETWLAHEYLPGRNLNWTSVWHDGELIASSTGERLKYFLAQVAVSGITGNVSHCRLVAGGQVNEIAKSAVLGVSDRPHGIFAVDLREDRHQRPRVTEINARCAFRPLLYTHGGANFPAILADLVLRGVRPAVPACDAALAGWEMIRGMDFEPLFRFTP